jgi:hypothetical protein
MKPPDGGVSVVVSARSSPRIEMFGRSGCGFGTTRSTQVRMSVSRQSRSATASTVPPIGGIAAAHCTPTAGSTTPVTGSAATGIAHLSTTLSSDRRARSSASAGERPLVM